MTANGYSGDTSEVRHLGKTIALLLILVLGVALTGGVYLYENGYFCHDSFPSYLCNVEPVPPVPIGVAYASPNGTQASPSSMNRTFNGGISFGGYFAGNEPVSNVSIVLTASNSSGIIFSIPFNFTTKGQFFCHAQPSCLAIYGQVLDNGNNVSNLSNATISHYCGSVKYCYLASVTVVVSGGILVDLTVSLSGEGYSTKSATYWGLTS